MAKKIVAIILAAGKSTRMKSNIPKVLLDVCGKPVLGWVVDSIKNASISYIITVIGNNKETIRKEFNASGIEWIEQKKQLGTGHAVKMAKSILKNFYGMIIVLQGDVPLIKSETIKKLINKHKKQKADVTILTANIDDPGSYGRIIRDKNGEIKKITEEADANPDEKTIKEINSGIYVFNAQPLFDALKLIKQNDRKKEYYLTDIIYILYKMKKKIESLCIEDSSQISGINTQKELVKVAKVAQTEILSKLMDGGVTIVDPSNTLVETGAKIGSGTIIYPNTYISRYSIVGKGCRIGPFVSLKGNIRLGDGCEMGYITGLN